MTIDGIPPRYAEKLQKQDHEKKLRSLHQAQEMELEKMRHLHSMRVKELEQQGQIELSAKQFQYFNREQDLLAAKEKKLETIQKGLEYTQQITEKEKKELLENLAQLKNELKVKTAKEIEFRQQEKALALEDQNHRLQHELQLLNTDYSLKNNSMQKDQQNFVSQNKANNKNQVNQLKFEFETVKGSEEKKYVQAMQQQRLDQARVMTSSQRQHQQRLELLNNYYQDKLAQMQTQRENDMLAVQKEFEKDYQTTLNTNEEQIKATIGRKENLIEKLRNELLESSKLTQAQSKDPFYLKTDLDYEIKKNPNDYQIKVSIPDHLKESLRLTADRKEVKILIDRRFEINNDDEQGKSSVKRVETRVQKFNLDDFLDAKKISRFDQPGEVIFTIPKLTA